MNKNNAIVSSGIGKQYVLGGAEQKYESFGDLLTGLVTSPFKKFQTLSGGNKESEFWALRDVNFEIPEGQVTGVIGRNGAGKSTLLKVLSRITTPTTGEVTIRGRVASLLEVGSGFHPELTGRENIFMNASILGLKRAQVVERLDEIVAFAEVEKFLDTPVKRYSSGMYVRLAFSVAAHIEPDVLLVDEVLAVGDAAFQQRCIGKLSDVSQQGRTVIFVSHNMGLVQDLCTHSLYLKDGLLNRYGLTEDVLPEYLTDGVETLGVWASTDEKDTLTELKITDTQGNCVQSSGYKDRLFAEIKFTPSRKDTDYVLALRITDELGRDILTSWDQDSLQRETQLGKCQLARCELPVGLLRPGRYFILVMLRNLKHGYLEGIEEACVEFEVTDVDFQMNANRFGVVLPTLNWECYAL